MEDMQPNPLLQPEDHYAGYNQSIDAMKNNPEAIELERLCYEVFEASEMGRKFMEIIQERYLLRGFADKNDPNFERITTWGEGFKDVFRMISTLVISHKQRIKAGADNARRNAT